MTAAESSLENYFSTTLTSTVNAGDVTIPLDDLGSLASPAYFIIDPDSDTNREVIYADGTWTGAAAVLSSAANRGLAGSGSSVTPGSGRVHAAGTVVTQHPLVQVIDDAHDRIDVHTHDGTTADSAVDHSDLTGLTTGDPHTQYSLADGSRAFTGEVEFPDGTAAAPAIRFTSDTDTGIYRSAANTIGFTTNGVEEATIDPATGLYVLSGVYTDGIVTGVGGLQATSPSLIGDLTAADIDANSITLSDGSNLGLRAVQVFTASGTWTKPAWLARARIVCIGGGGGGAGAQATTATTCSAGHGGGGAAHAESTIAAGSLGATETVTIGAGGTAGGGGTGGGNGGDTSFGTHVIAKGGSGGTVLTAQTTDAFGSGTAGGGANASTGDIKMGGQAGHGAARLPSLNTCQGGNGGSAGGMGGGGGPALQHDSNGQSGYLYGGGGSGGSSRQSSTTHTGGEGAQGICIVYEYG